MAAHASSVTTVSPEERLDQPPVSPASAERSTAASRNRPRALEVAQCSLCGIALPLGLLVPDGGQACTDIRWYCKDATSCTNRWTAAHAPMPAAHGDAFAGTFAPGRSSEEDTRV